MQSNIIKKIFKFYRWIILLFFFVVNSCISAQDGERFGIGIASELSKPPLEYAILISDNNTIRVNGAGAHTSFGAENGVIIPNEIEFLWRSLGEKIPHSKKIKLRSQVPENILYKISGLRPMFSLNLEFFVINNVPKFRWDVTKFYIDHLPPEEIERGGDW